jgi:hypothetical protein
MDSESNPWISEAGGHQQTPIFPETTAEGLGNRTRHARGGRVMSLKKSARPTTAAANREPLSVDHAGGQIDTTTTSKQNCLQVIRAEIIGMNICTAEGYVVRAAAPVLTACRKLIAAGFDPNRALHAYRCETLCVTVPSIGAAAALTVDETRSAFARWKPFPSAAGSTEIAQHKSRVHPP